MTARIMQLYRLHDYFNEMDFSDKLMKVRMLLKRGWHTAGVYEYHAMLRNGIKDMPDRNRLDEATIAISSVCFSDKRDLEGAVLHEMVHQYQTEVMDIPIDHGPVFKSICRYLERKYGYEVR